MPLTENEKTAIQIQNDIDRLDLQRKNLQAQVDGLAVECNDLYTKRSAVNQEIELAKIEVAEKSKALDVERSKLKAELKKLEDERSNIRFGNEKLSQEREAFRVERKIYEQRLTELAEKEGESVEKSKKLDVKEKSLEDLENELGVRDRKFNSEIATLKIELESSLNSAKSLEIQAKNDKGTADSTIKEYQQKLSGLEIMETELKKKLSEKERVFNAECDAIKNNLRKRELGIVEREKELDNLKLEYKVKLEDIQIEKGRVAASDKDKKKK